MDEITEKVLKRFEEKQTKEFGIHDGVIIGLLEEVLGKLKSLKILIENENFDSNDIVMRSAFEAYVYLFFILEDDTEKRARAYAYKNKVEEIKLFEQMTEGSRKGNAIRGYLGITLEEVLANNPQINSEYIIRIKEKYENLFSPKEMKKTWFDFDNKTKNFEQLCTKMGMEVEYNLIYRIFSKDVHSNRALSRLKFTEKEVSVGVFDKGTLLHRNMASLILVKLGRKVLQYYKLQNDLNLFNANVRVNYKLK